MPQPGMHEAEISNTAQASHCLSMAADLTVQIHQKHVQR